MRKVPKLCHHKASGRAYVTDPATGKPVYLGRWGTREAEQAYERWRAGFLARPECAPRLPPAGSRVTVDQLLRAYLDHAEHWYRKKGEPTSHLPLCRRVAAWVRLVCGEQTAAGDVRGRHMEDLQARLVAAGLARSTVNKMARKMAAVWTWGVGKDLVPAEAAERLRAVGWVKKGRLGARETKKVRPVEVGIVLKTLPHLRPVLKAMVLLQLYAGMRPGEVCALRPREVDRSELPWTYRPEHWKTEHRAEDDDDVREVWLGPRCREALAPLLEGADPDSALFRMRGGRPFSEDAYREAIYRACDRAGVKRWAPNRLRHQAGTEARRHYGLEGARVRLGHEHADITQDYAIRDSDLGRRIAEELG